MELAINNVIIVTGSEMYKGAVGVQDGKIAYVGEESISAETIIDGEGKLLIPGLVDHHVHLNDPGFTWREDLEHATRAAAAGGITTVVDMPLQNEPAVASADIYEKKAQVFENRSLVDYSFWGALVNYNLEDMEGLRNSGVKAFKSFMCPVGKDYTSLFLGEIRERLILTKAFGALAAFHCEDYNIIAYEQEKAVREGRVTVRDYLDARPLSAELIATQSILDLAEETQAPVHICHASHRKVIDRIQQYRDKGVRATVETCPHYLLFDEEDVMAGDYQFKCSPPIREHENLNGMWEAVEQGLIDCIVSDHSPASAEEKADSLSAFDAWGGISGLQTGLQIMYEEGVNRRGLSPVFISRMMAENPAKLFGFGDKKGRIACGYDADLVLFDPTKEWEIDQDSLYYLNPLSAFCGCKGKGMGVKTWLRGEVIYDQDALEAKATFCENPKGQLLRC